MGCCFSRSADSNAHDDVISSVVVETRLRASATSRRVASNASPMSSQNDSSAQLGDVEMELAPVEAEISARHGAEENELAYVRRQLVFLPESVYSSDHSNDSGRKSRDEVNLDSPVPPMQLRLFNSDWEVESDSRALAAGDRDKGVEENESSSNEVSSATTSSVDEDDESADSAQDHEETVSSDEEISSSTATTTSALSSESDKSVNTLRRKELGVPRDFSELLPIQPSSISSTCIVIDFSKFATSLPKLSHSQLEVALESTRGLLPASADIRPTPSGWMQDEEFKIAKSPSHNKFEFNVNIHEIESSEDEVERQKESFMMILTSRV